MPMKSGSKNRAPNTQNLTVKRRYLTEREIERLMDCARKHGRYGHRDATMILVAYRHGLRASPKTPTYSFPSAAGRSVPLVSTASSNGSGKPPRCHSQSIPTCFAMLAGSSSRTMATTRAPYSTTSDIRIFSTPSGTPKWRPTGSRIFGEATKG
jgi:hypothetical protein